MTGKQVTAMRIMGAYKQAENSLHYLGNILRTTEAGRYSWATAHKTAISGLKSILNILSRDVPAYDDDDV